MPHATNYSSPGFTLDGCFLLTGAFSRISQTATSSGLALPSVGFAQWRYPHIILDGYHRVAKNRQVNPQKSQVWDTDATPTDTCMTHSSTTTSA